MKYVTSGAPAPTLRDLILAALLALACTAVLGLLAVLVNGS